MNKILFLLLWNYHILVRFNFKLYYKNGILFVLKKENGGLSVKRLREFNISSMSKWVWRMLEERESLWNLVLRAKYGEEGGRVRFCKGVGSIWWRNLNQV